MNIGKSLWDYMHETPAESYAFKCNTVHDGSDTVTVFFCKEAETYEFDFIKVI